VWDSLCSGLRRQLHLLRLRVVGLKEKVFPQIWKETKDYWSRMGEFLRYFFGPLIFLGIFAWIDGVDLFIFIQTYILGFLMGTVFWSKQIKGMYDAIVKDYQNAVKKNNT
jgi:hypothetical protein